MVPHPINHVNFSLMKTPEICLFMIAIVASTLMFPACRSKMIVAPSAEVEMIDQDPVEEKVEETTVIIEEKTPEPAPVVEKPNFNFRNIQFEFDSSVLKTDSYDVLDGIAREMKKAPTTKFSINGHSSIEGTPEYNQSLSEDRANAVKLYLVNAGIKPDNLVTEGYGATKPASSNDTDSGKALNRRVEVKAIR